MATSCATGPQPPEPGTPAFIWDAAQKTLKSGDLVKTNDNLFELLQNDNDYTAKARIWQIVLSAGMAQGAEDLATAYAAGARLNKDHPQTFWKGLSQTRAQAGHSALDMATQIQTLLAKDKSPQIAMEFPFPPGSSIEPPALKTVQAGTIILEANADVLQTAMLERGLIQALCKLVGTPDDPNKAAELFKTPPVHVARETFLLAAAKILYDESAVFGSSQLDQPQRLKAMYDQALAALGQVPETGETKALSALIKSAEAKLPLT
jgi:hypothetical protein